MWQLLVRKSRALACSASVVKVVQREGAVHVVVVGIWLMVMVLGSGDGGFEGIKMPLSLRSMWVMSVMGQ